MISADELKSVLSYDAESGTFKWINTRFKKKTKNGFAGSYKANGYIRIKIKEVEYAAHRLAWLYVYGEIPDADIDHIDGNRDNNRINNLRPSTRSQNLHNAKLSKRNTSGFKNVTFSKRLQKWRVVITAKGCIFEKCFESVDEAVKCAELKRNELHGEFARAC